MATGSTGRGDVMRSILRMRKSPDMLRTADRPLTPWIQPRRMVRRSLARRQPMAFRDEFAGHHPGPPAAGPFTHLRIGGPAEFLVTPRTRDELARVVAACAAEKIPLRVLGVGTNLLVRDEGVTGVVVRMTAAGIHAVSASPGGPSKPAAGRRCSRSSARPLGRAGRVRDAGRHHGDGRRGVAIQRRRSFGRNRRSPGPRRGHRRRRDSIVVRERGDIRFGEHDSDLDDPVVLGVEFALETDDPDAIVKRMRRAWINRKADQPLSHQAAVRVFRNPHGQTAAHLLDRAGLVRARVGAAR